MDRNTPTTVDQLQTGDRFFKAADKKREMWTMLPVLVKPKKTFYKTYKYQANKDGAPHPDYMNGNTKVIFIRHAEEKPVV